MSEKQREQQVQPVDSKLKFSNRVEDYALHRPSYPRALMDVLTGEGYFDSGESVADVGAGTGKLSALFADTGATVYCIEPNSEMLHACIGELGGRSNCHFIRATAEQTALHDGSVDIISAGQAFHWFDTGAVRAEFLRVLHPHGKVFIVWNTRAGNASPFMTEYGKLLKKYGTGSAPQMSSERSVIGKFFGNLPFTCGEVPNSQTLDFDGLMGRLRSSSYLPVRGSPDYGPLLSDARTLFDRFQKNGLVELVYRTEYFIGRPGLA